MSDTARRATASLIALLVVTAAVVYVVQRHGDETGPASQARGGHATGEPDDEPAPEDPPSPARDGTEYFDEWIARIPSADQVGRRWTVTPDDTYALRTGISVRDVTAVGGSSAAILARGGDITISSSLLGGATDGLKPDDDTTLRDSVISVDYAPGGHADHVQVRNRDRVTLQRIRMVAENASGTTDRGFNAGIFVHEDSTDWRIEDVYIQAGRPSHRIQSWHPVRLLSGQGHVEGLVIDREAIKPDTDTPILVGDDVTILTWRDVHIREPDGSLTPLPRP